MFHALFGFTIFSAGIPTTFRCVMKARIFSEFICEVEEKVVYL